MKIVEQFEIRENVSLFLSSYLIPFLFYIDNGYFGGPGWHSRKATSYGLDGLGFKPQGWRDFPDPSRLAPRPTQSPGWDVALNIHPILTMRSNMSTAIFAPPLFAAWCAIAHPFYLNLRFISDQVENN